MIGYYRIDGSKFHLTALGGGKRAFQANATIEVARHVIPRYRMKIVSRELDNLCLGLREIEKGKFDKEKI